MTNLKNIAENHNAWPFQEARALLKRLGGKLPEKGFVAFETGYGPSGLPHIGTFGEVARTSMVRYAFEVLTGWPTKLICFSDDMDGFRKVPENIPQPEMLAEYLGQPLSNVPDPFGTHESFAAHNNNRLCEFLDQFGFDYDFHSATECYASGLFDDTLLKILANYDRIIDVILPTLGEERRKTYSPFLPISPSTGEVLQVAIDNIDADAGTVSFTDVDGKPVTQQVTGGKSKLQWKVDWAMRWTALDIDYEMAGKDLAESVKLSSIIRRVLSGTPPTGFSYEMFLDEKGEKISKSKGNGLTIEEWLAYASPESLSLFMYQKPKTAKKLYFEVIPKAVDEYYTLLSKYADEDDQAKLNNPAYHIHAGNPPSTLLPVSFSLLLNLVGAANTEDISVLEGFVGRYLDSMDAASEAELKKMMGYAIRYYIDFVAPTKSYRLPEGEAEQKAFSLLRETLNKWDGPVEGEALQTEIYTIGKTCEFENLRDWFRALYEVLLGQSQGPRMGNFIELFGIERTLEMLDTVLSGKTLG